MGDMTVAELKDMIEGFASTQKDGYKETRAMWKATDKRIQETDARLEKMYREADERFKKTEAMFTSQWGKLVESLVEGSLVHILEQRGIMVLDNSERNVIKDKQRRTLAKIDIMAKGEKDLVLVEVKSTLKNDHIEEFLEMLGKFKSYRPEYQPYRLMGAVAFLKADGNSDRQAEKKGLIVIKAGSDYSASIVNREDFEPREF